MAICLEELQDNKLYNRKFYLPFVDEDKTHGSIVYLLSKSESTSNKLMNNQFTINTVNKFQSYYTERNLTYILTGVGESMMLENTGIEDIESIGAFAVSNILSVIPKSGYKSTILEALEGKAPGNYTIQSYDTVSGNISPFEIGTVSLYEDGSYEWINKENIVYDTNGYIKPLEDYRDDELEDSIISNEPIEATLNGAFDSDNIWNSLIVLGDKNYRERCEALVFYGNKVYLSMFKDGKGYRIPGGGTETTCSIAEQVKNECKEEARLILKNVKYTKSYTKRFNKKYDGFRGLPFEYHGSINHLYIAEFNGFYNGFIRAVDRDDSMYIHGDFYPIEEVYDLLNKYHKAAVDVYLKSKNMIMQEGKLSTKERKELDDNEYGIPKLRKYPLNDADHVRSAIRFFNHCEPKYEKELAANIIKAAKKYDVEIKVSESNRLSKYVKEDK